MQRSRTHVEVSTSLPDLEVAAYANVGATTSLAIGQTTQTALGLGIGESTAPVAGEVPSMAHPSYWCYEFPIPNPSAVSVENIALVLFMNHSVHVDANKTC